MNDVNGTEIEVGDIVYFIRDADTVGGIVDPKLIIATVTQLVGEYVIMGQYKTKYSRTKIAIKTEI